MLCVASPDDTFQLKNRGRVFLTQKMILCKITEYKCHCVGCHYAERHYFVCCYAKCHSGECHCAECRGEKMTWIA
jgi:hypothetical protein